MQWCGDHTFILVNASDAICVDGESIRAAASVGAIIVSAGDGAAIGCQRAAGTVVGAQDTLFGVDTSFKIDVQSVAVGAATCVGANGVETDWDASCTVAGNGKGWVRALILVDAGKIISIEHEAIIATAGVGADSVSARLLTARKATAGTLMQTKQAFIQIFTNDRIGTDLEAW